MQLRKTFLNKQTKTKLFYIKNRKERGHTPQTPRLETFSTQFIVLIFMVKTQMSDY